MSMRGLWPGLLTASLHQAFSTFNLVLNTYKTKVMWFGKKNAPLPTGVITTYEGIEL